MGLNTNIRKCTIMLLSCIFIFMIGCSTEPIEDELNSKSPSSSKEEIIDTESDEDVVDNESSSSSKEDTIDTESNADITDSESSITRTANDILNVPIEIILAKPGDTYQLEPSFEGYEDAEFTYLSGVEDIVTVSDSGLITYLETEVQTGGVLNVYVGLDPQDEYEGIIADILVAAQL